MAERDKRDKSNERNIEKRDRSGGVGGRVINEERLSNTVPPPRKPKPSDGSSDKK